MKKLLVILALIWGGGAAGVWYWNELGGQQVAFRTVSVRRGDLLATINATGTLEPEEVVDVGVQIAGEIKRFGPDLRDPSKPINSGSPVDEGTILAELNDALLKARLSQARASLERAEADVLTAQAKFRRAERDLERVRKLHAKNTISAQEYDAALAESEMSKANLALTQSSVALAQANLEEANVHLGYATIRSPVKGVILDRRVNVGQTVGANLNLFLIAKDLSRMEIWASVNETDVGAIHVGQGVRFTVGTPNESFRGKVSQIRLNANMTQNVVTYTVLVGVDDPNGKLLPYLTARVQFEVEERKDALLVPNAALRWQPKVEQVAPEMRTSFANSLRQRAAAPKAPIHPTKGQTKVRERGTLWVTRAEFVRPISVELGLTDGLQTEILGDDVRDGLAVVVGQAAQDGETDPAAPSPFLPQLKNDKSKK